jgi:branched-chain amino acid transport system ATP-binding protein
MLQTTDLTIRFGGHVAVNAVSCRFEPGTLTAIVGPNGAGKTTYFNLISGSCRPVQAGELNGQDLSGCRVGPHPCGPGPGLPADQPVSQPQVLENVRLAVQAAAGGPHRRGLNLWSIWSDHRRLTERGRDPLLAVCPVRQARPPVASLPHGDQRKLEVAC